MIPEEAAQLLYETYQRFAPEYGLVKSTTKWMQLEPLKRILYTESVKCALSSLMCATAEIFASRLYRFYEVLAPQYGYQVPSWNDVQENKRDLLILASGHVVMEMCAQALGSPLSEGAIKNIFRRREAERVQ